MATKVTQRQYGYRNGHEWVYGRILPNGNFIITASPSYRAEMRRVRDSGKCDLYHESDLFQHLGLEQVQPEWIGAMTDSPIVTDPDNSDFPDDADHPIIGSGPVWWHPNYMVESMIDTIIERGSFVMRSSVNS